MKKPRRSESRSASKRKAARPTVDQYIARAPEPGRAALKEMRKAIRSVVPAEATEVISYGIPAFKDKGIIAWYAAFSDHCSLFPTAAAVDKFRDELKGLSTSKGTIHFPLNKPLPVALIKKIVKWRLAESEGKGL